MPQEVNQEVWQSAQSTQASIWHKLAAMTPQLSTKGLRLVLVAAGLVIVLNLLQVLLSYQGIGGELVLEGLMAAIFVGLFGILATELVGLYIVKKSSWLDKVVIERYLNNNLPLHTPSKVQLIIQYPAPPTWLSLVVVDHVPNNTTADDLPVRLMSRQLTQQGVCISYTITPFARGQAGFDGVSMALVGRFSLLSLYHHYDEKHLAGQHSVRILANFRQSLSGHLFAAAHRSVVDGLIHQRQRGQGQDFYQIRAYSEGDSIRHIDWRATSRLNRLMTKEYQDDQDQELLFLIDGSMHMCYQRFVQNDGGFLKSVQKHSVNHLDDVLNAMLLLSSIATTQGDSVGFISFSGVNDKVVPAKKGTSVVSHLLNQSYDIQSSLKMPDYMAAAKMAMSLQKKRSLIILMTTTRSEDFDELLQAVNLLRAKHLVLVANLYESDFDYVMTTPPNTPDEAFRYHAVREHLNIQHSLKLQLEGMAHVYAIHCTPEQLAPALVDNYLLMKQGLR